MPCCTTTIQTFSNAVSTTIPYVGVRPTVTVSYNIDGVWYAMGVATVVQITATNVIVTHGGVPNLGVIKMVQ